MKPPSPQKARVDRQNNRTGAQNDPPKTTARPELAAEETNGVPKTNLQKANLAPAWTLIRILVKYRLIPVSTWCPFGPR